MNTRTFPCKRDFFAGMVSIAVPAGAVGMLALAFFSPEESRSSLIAAALLMLILSGTCLLYAPKEYLIQPDGIEVRRIVGLKKFQSEKLLLIRKVDAAEMQGLIRTFGNGGLFGYTGRYYSPSIGQQSWYCSRRSGLVIIQLREGLPVIFSPEDPKSFVEAANELITKA